MLESSRDCLLGVPVVLNNALTKPSFHELTLFISRLSLWASSLIIIHFALCSLVAAYCYRSSNVDVDWIAEPGVLLVEGYRLNRLSCIHTQWRWILEAASMS
jgi:hypothetical protein